MKPDATRHGKRFLSFESSPICQRTHAESIQASFVVRDESPVQGRPGLPLIAWELLSLIEDYRQGLVPLVVPLTLMKHHLSRYPVPDWVHQQVYVHPYPKELMLRNHV
jgi:hypothetical protein